MQIKQFNPCCKSEPFWLRGRGGSGAGRRLCVGMLGWQGRAAISEPVKTEDWPASRSGVNHRQSISHTLTNHSTYCQRIWNTGSLDAGLSFDPELTIVCHWIKSSICTIYLLLYSITKMQSVAVWPADGVSTVSTLVTDVLQPLYNLQRTEGSMWRVNTVNILHCCQHKPAPINSALLPFWLRQQTNMLKCPMLVSSSVHLLIASYCQLQGCNLKPMTVGAMPIAHALLVHSASANMQFSSSFRSLKLLKMVWLI